MIETATDFGPLLDQLAEECGIQSAFSDIWGASHAVSRRTKLAVLAAMGLPVDDVDALREALERPRRRRWKRALAAVNIVIGQTQPCIAVSVPEAKSGHRLRWALRQEDGRRHEGDFVADELPCSQRAEIDGRAYLSVELTLPVALPLGYHSLTINEVGHQGEALRPEVYGEMSLIVAPERCHKPEAVRDGQRVWGPAVQLYALRSSHDWGIGDYTTLREVVEVSSELGASIVGLNPLHALFPHNPPHASPYSPSSRLFLNLLYLDVEAVAEFGSCEEARRFVGAPVFQQRLQAARQRELIDYDEVAALKRPVLEQLYQHFCSRELALDTERARAFQRFVADAGEPLHRHALHEALQEHFYTSDPQLWGWPVWPAAYQNPSSEEVLAFAVQWRHRILFFQYVQWLADDQLSEASARVTELGLGVGLYADLAVSVDGAGAEVWANQDVYAVDASAGAPPDDFNLQGQSWGLPPLIPDRLRERAYEPLIAALRANMRHAGALRIDHVMGLMRLYWVPRGLPATDGAYVHYPFDDLLGIVALESHRNRCLVIGEDLGTVPDEVRAAMARIGVLSYRPLLFQREQDGGFTAPATYPRCALVTATTHDLPTLQGYWLGRDIEARAEVGQLTDEVQRNKQLVARADDRGHLLAALKREGLLPSSSGATPSDIPQLTPDLIRALHVYLARAPSQVMMVQWEDLLRLAEQANLPGTIDEHPNWRRRLPVSLRELAKNANIRAVAAALRGERPSP